MRNTRYFLKQYISSKIYLMYIMSGRVVATPDIGMTNKVFFWILYFLGGFKAQLIRALKCEGGVCTPMVPLFQH